jgi:hypothetical protein
LDDLRYPKMPRESDPDYEQWKAQIQKELATVEDEVIFRSGEIIFVRATTS